jgi:hypothetical protein
MMTSGRLHNTCQTPENPLISLLSEDYAAATPDVGAPGKESRYECLNRTID